MSADVDIDLWLAERGFGLPEARELARMALEIEGLTRSGKARLSVDKLTRAALLLDVQFALHCSSPECEAWAKASGRDALLCEPKAACSRCHGSDNQRAVRDFLEHALQHEMSKLVVVGGSPTLHHELERLIGTNLDLRLIDGTKLRGTDRAHADVEWADLVLIWGGTELHHKVSMQYTNVLPPLRRKIVQVAKRSISQLLLAAIEHFKRG
ncbi:MAG: hypothetical protein JNG84_05940 [Archangium sp.]|nr:hypothetical protein [Archangium sp.]